MKDKEFQEQVGGAPLFEAGECVSRLAERIVEIRD